MPWTPGGSDVELLDQLGWTPDGPDAAAPDPVLGWWHELESSGFDIGRGADQAAAAALLVGADIGRGGDQATAVAALTGADIGRGSDIAAALLSLTGTDIGHGSDQASGLIPASGFDIGRGTDASGIVVQPGAFDIGRGSDTAPLTGLSVAGSDVGRGADTAAPKYLNAWAGSAPATQINGDSTWYDLITFTSTGIGTGTCNFSVTHSWSGNGLQWVTVERRLRITVNGTQVGSYASQSWRFNTSWNTTSTWTGASVPAGATIAIQGWSNGPYADTRKPTISAASMAVTAIS